MTSSSSGDVTRLLEALNDGDDGAADTLIRVVYKELKAVAASHMSREDAGHTLQPTALVHEAYLRLVNQRRVKWNGRAHFFAIAAQAMRRVLIDHARRKKALRRGGDRAMTLLELHATDTTDSPGPVDLLALNSALERLAEQHQRQTRIIELRYFGGLSVKETAEVLQVSEATVKRDWRYARAWLFREIQTGDAARSDARSTEN